MMDNYQRIESFDRQKLIARLNHGSYDYAKLSARLDSEIDIDDNAFFEDGFKSSIFLGLVPREDVEREKVDYVHRESNESTRFKEYRIPLQDGRTLLLVQQIHSDGRSSLDVPGYLEESCYQSTQSKSSESKVEPLSKADQECLTRILDRNPNNAFKGYGIFFF